MMIRFHANQETFNSSNSVVMSETGGPFDKPYYTFNNNSFIYTKNLYRAPFVLSVYFKIDSPPSRVEVLVSPKYYFNANNVMTVMMNPDKRVSIRDSNGIQFVEGNKADGTWHHLVLAYDGSTKSFHVDGVEQPITITNYSQQETLTIGGTYEQNSFSGQISPFFWLGTTVDKNLLLTPPTEFFDVYVDVGVTINDQKPLNAFQTEFPLPIHKDLVFNFNDQKIINGERGGTLIGGDKEIVGVVKKKAGDLVVPYGNATIILTDERDGRQHRRVYPEKDGTFVIPDLADRGDFAFTVTDWFSDAYATIIRARAGNTYEVILETKEETPKPSHKVEGIVRNHLDQPISRKVCVYSRKTNAVLGTIQSKQDGTYSIPFVWDNEPVYVVCLPNPDEDINAKIFDRVAPVPI